MRRMIMDRTNTRRTVSLNAVMGLMLRCFFTRVVQSLWLSSGSVRLLRRQYDAFAVAPKARYANFRAESTRQRMNSRSTIHFPESLVAPLGSRLKD